MFNNIENDDLISEKQINRLACMLVYLFECVLYINSN